MMKLFFGAWALYAVLFIVMPFKLPSGGNAEAIAIILAFLSIVALSYMAVLRLVRLPAITAPFDTERGFHMLVWLGIGLSALGFALLIYDRIFIQKIDFSQGLAYARAQWTDLGSGRNTPSSIFSVAGYLLGSTYFVSLVMGLTRMHLMTRRQLAAVLGMVFLLAMINSAIAGGRTTLLLLVAFVVCALVLRAPGSVRERLSGRMFRRGSYALAIVMFIYVTYITLDRARNSDISIEAYLVGAVGYLQLELRSWYVEHLRNSSFSELTAPVVYIGAYLTHSYAILCEIVNGPQEDKVLIFGHALGLLSKLGLVAPPDGNWFLGGRFPSLPGALWHQFGPAGLVAGSAVLGAISAIAVQCYRAAPDFVLFQGFQICCGTILILSPLLFAADLMVFPFIVVGFVVIAAIQFALAPKSSVAGR